MYALIEKSTNNILRISNTGVELAPEKPFYWKECPDNCTIEWSFDGVDTFTPPEVSTEPVVEVPLSVSKAQAKVVLYEDGYYQTIEDFVNHPDTSIIVKIGWRETSNFERYSPTVLFMQQYLQLTDAQMDQLFIRANAVVI